MIDRVVQKRRAAACPRCRSASSGSPPGLFDGSLCFGGEESAGASFLRRDGTVWTTDKDGPIMDLLAAEITARTGKDPGEHYEELTGGIRRLPTIRGSMRRRRRSRRRSWRKLSPEAVKASELAGETIVAEADAGARQ